MRPSLLLTLTAQPAEEGSKVLLTVQYLQRVWGLARFWRSGQNPASWPLAAILRPVRLALRLLNQPGSGGPLVYSEGQLRPTHQHQHLCYFLGSWLFPSRTGAEERVESRPTQRKGTVK